MSDEAYALGPIGKAIDVLGRLAEEGGTQIAALEAENAKLRGILDELREKVEWQKGDIRYKAPEQIEGCVVGYLGALDALIPARASTPSVSPDVPSNAPTSVQEILAVWLKDNAYDGLVSDGSECGCEISNLIPCDAPCERCCPGYKGPDPDGECDFLIYHSREAVEAARKGQADG